METVGAELRVALVAIGRGDINAGDNSFWLRKCCELCLRPAIEPLLLAHWEKLRAFKVSEKELATLCSMLTGSKQQARTRDHCGLWDGGNVKFEPAAIAASWWEDIQSVASNPELESVLPAYCFARTIIAHPYPDGNGRLARALVHAALAREYDLDAPFLPLAPAFYMNGAKVAVALRNLSDTGNWETFDGVLWQVIEDAANLTRMLNPSRE